MLSAVSAASTHFNSLSFRRFSAQIVIHWVTGHSEASLLKHKTLFSIDDDGELRCLVGSTFATLLALLCNHHNLPPAAHRALQRKNVNYNIHNNKY